MYAVSTGILLLFTYLGTFICSTESAGTESVVVERVLRCFKENGVGYSVNMDEGTVEYVYNNITKMDIEQLLLSTPGKIALSVLKYIIRPELFEDFVNHENFVDIFAADAGVARPSYQYLSLLMLNFTRMGGAQAILNVVGDGMILFLPDSYAKLVQGVAHLLNIDIFSMLFQSVTEKHCIENLDRFAGILNELRKASSLGDDAKKTILQDLEVGNSTYFWAGLSTDLGHLNFVKFTECQRSIRENGTTWRLLEDYFGSAFD